MKYVFVSPHGDGLSAAFQLKRAGNDVCFAFMSDDDGGMGKDMGVPMYDDYHEVLMKYPKEQLILIFDANSKGWTADYLRSQGYYVFGGSVFCDTSENEREEGRAVMEMMTPTPLTAAFENFDQGKKFVKMNADMRFVFKPDGEGIPKEWTYVSKESGDLMDRMDYYKEHWPKTTPISFELQEFKKGIECDFCGIFNGEKWLEGSFEWYFEEKKAFDGEKGPATGCADALQFYTTSQEPYFQQYLKKLTPFLKEKNYRGIFSVNNIYVPEEDTFYPLELTPRLGYDSTQNEIHALMKAGKNPADMFKAVAMGKSLPKDYFPQDYYNFDVRVSIPPYPNYEGPHYAIGLQNAKGKVVDIQDDLWPDFFPDDICYNEDEDQYECAGVCATLGVVASSEDTIEGAIANAYDNLIPKLHAPDMFYRTDGAKRVKKDVQALIKAGAILPRKKI